MVYYVDIDGTICTNTFGDYENAIPIRSNIEKINRLFEDGNEVVYWTARGGTTGIDWGELTRAQLEAWGVKYTGLKMKKPHYDLFICDKAINSDVYFKD